MMFLLTPWLALAEGEPYAHIRYLLQQNHLYCIACCISEGSTVKFEYSSVKIALRSQSQQIIPKRSSYMSRRVLPTAPGLFDKSL